jgi:L-fucose mutarotase
MLKTKLLHPEILMALASNGHGAKILIADGNFPITTCTPSSAKRVFLNLAPGLLTTTEVLRVLKDHISIESATTMVPMDDTPQSIHKEFAYILGESLPLTALKRFEFYEQAKKSDVCLAIATGETRRFANLLLEIGVVKHEPISQSVIAEARVYG